MITIQYNIRKSPNAQRKSASET